MNKEKVTVSLRIDRHLHEQMKLREETNWSAVLRKSLERTLEEPHRIDHQRLRAARQGMDELRRSGAFSAGKPAVEVIRAWRDKRR